MDTLGLFLSMGVAGGLGAVARLVLDRMISFDAERRFPWGTNIVNVTGSFALGYVSDAAMTSEHWRTIVAVGLLGGFTTFSTASLETVVLLGERRRLPATLNALGMLIACVVAAVLGLSLAG